ncbi:unnamed protein product [Ectocarpus sp. CCAP 1310/34]|nr:unnamed protein product [Ectocarpus sp. CCAP 1310/34]
MPDVAVGVYMAESGGKSVSRYGRDRLRWNW